MRQKDAQKAGKWRIPAEEPFPSKPALEGQQSLPHDADAVGRVPCQIVEHLPDRLFRTRAIPRAIQMTPTEG